MGYSRAEPLPSAQRYEKVSQLRQLAHDAGLLLQEEARSIAVSLFGPGALIVNLGLAKPVANDWYQLSDSAYGKAIMALLEQLMRWSDLEALDLLITNGSDPFTTLQVGLDRQIFSWQSPTIIGDQLSTQRIYSFSRHSPND
ncbi:MAG: hypothetical protein AAF808_04610 [Cyanobacteria bacterium P01_D01_bin.2]